MAYREFVDSSGASWRVWSTEPLLSGHLDGGFANGWLTFERLVAGADSPSPSVRRMAPIPRDWESVSDERLELMCRAAEEVLRRIADPATRPPASDGPDSPAVTPP
ncbi:MAG TPA: hypothetical protein VJU87_06540 [Gemmatimonadaceae bacterium]|nr:hypothetical protein [Gemmatimonadaceae bacterium]